MTRVSRWLVVVLVLALLGGGLLPAAAQDGDSWDAIRADYPRVDGSTSAEPLQRVIAAEVHGLPWLWMWGGLDGGYFIAPGLAQADIGSYERVMAADQIWGIRHNGTHDAYMNLIAGDTDFILVARQPSQDEIDAAQRAGVTLDVQPVAYDAFVFLVHSDNPIASLTLDEIRGIYTGDITDWTALGVEQPIPGAADTAIHAFTRNPNSGSQELMQALVMGALPMIDAPDMMMMGMAGLINEVNYTPNGLGYSVYFYASFINPGDHTRLIGVEGVVPAFDTIADGSYPLATEVYAVVRSDAASDSTAVLLRDWLLTDDGQAAVAASGYVPLRE